MPPSRCKATKSHWLPVKAPPRPSLLAKSTPHVLEPIFVDLGLYAALLETSTSKMPTVQVAAVEAVCIFIQNANLWGTGLLLCAPLYKIKTALRWQIKIGSLTILDQLIVSTPHQTTKLMPEVSPILTEAIWDTKVDVKKQARESLMKATALISNKDIEHFIPALIKSLSIWSRRFPTLYSFFQPLHSFRKWTLLRFP